MERIPLHTEYLQKHYRARFADLKSHSITPKSLLGLPLGIILHRISVLGKIPNTWENLQKPNKIIFIGLQIPSNPPYNHIGYTLGRFHMPRIDLGDLWSNNQYAISGDLRVQRLPAWKDGFPLSFASHASLAIWDRAEPTQCHLLLEARPKSHLWNSNFINHSFNSPSGPTISLWEIFPLYFSFYVEMR